MATVLRKGSLLIYFFFYFSLSLIIFFICPSELKLFILIFSNFIFILNSLSSFEISIRIVKESNKYDRKISDYKEGIDALLEAEKIKEEIFNLEHDLWEYKSFLFFNKFKSLPAKTFLI